MKHFFIDETTGKLFVIPEMPEIQDYEAVAYAGEDPVEYIDPLGRELYNQSIQSAKDRAVEVGNPDQVMEMIDAQMEQTYEIKLGTIYSLDCEVETTYKKVAFITFNTEEKKEEESQEDIWEEVQMLIDTYKNVTLELRTRFNITRKPKNPSV